MLTHAYRCTHLVTIPSSTHAAVPEGAGVGAVQAAEEVVILRERCDGFPPVLRAGQDPISRAATVLAVRPLCLRFRPLAAALVVAKDADGT